MKAGDFRFDGFDLGQRIFRFLCVFPLRILSLFYNQNINFLLFQQKFFLRLFIEKKKKLLIVIFRKSLFLFIKKYEKVNQGWRWKIKGGKFKEKCFVKKSTTHSLNLREENEEISAMTTKQNPRHTALLTITSVLKNNGRLFCLTSIELYNKGSYSIHN